jgi:CheY-like chemotaxis protein
MSEPLAVVYYSSLIPGSRLVSRLVDLGYRVHPLTALADLPTVCEREKPIVALVEISAAADGRREVKALRANPATTHIPVLAFCGPHDKAFAAAAQEAGISLLASSASALEQLPMLLDQALEVN